MPVDAYIGGSSTSFPRCENTQFGTVDALAHWARQNLTLELAKWGASACTAAMERNKPCLFRNSRHSSSIMLSSGISPFFSSGLEFKNKGSVCSKTEARMSYWYFPPRPVTRRRGKHAGVF
ncbi:unnamed protein product [Ectocarpus sp. 12 AP-2014]